MWFRMARSSVPWTHLRSRLQLEQCPLQSGTYSTDVFPPLYLKNDLLARRMSLQYRMERRKVWWMCTSLGLSRKGIRCLSQSKRLYLWKHPSIPLLWNVFYWYEAFVFPLWIRIQLITRRMWLRQKRIWWLRQRRKLYLQDQFQRRKMPSMPRQLLQISFLPSL